MKNLIISIIWFAVPVFTLFAVTCVMGCTQVILEPDRLQINAFLMSTGFENLYHEPNSIFEVNRYKTVPSDIELVYDPLTGRIKAKTKANQIEGE